MSIAKVTYSVIDATFLKEIVGSNYSIEEISTCLFFSRGVNDSYLIDTLNGTRYILRVYRKDWRSLTEVQYEKEVLVQLNRLNAGISRLIQRRDGEYVGRLLAPEGTRYYILMEYAGAGDNQYHCIVDDDITNYGNAVFQLHKNLAKLKLDSHRHLIDIDFLLGRPLIALSSYLKAPHPDLLYLKNLASKIQSILLDIGFDNLTKSIIHGDLTGGNAGRNNDGTIIFYDFDCCGYGFIAYDLAVFRWSARNFGDEAACWEKFIDGYRPEYLLNKSDVEAIPYFVVAREIWNIGYDISQTESGSRAKYSNRHFRNSVEFLRGWEDEWG